MTASGSPAESHALRESTQAAAPASAAVVALEHHAALGLAVLLQSPHPVWSKDLAGRYLSVNPAFELAFGLAAQEVLARDDAAVFGAESAARSAERERQVLASGQPLTAVERHERDGLVAEACVLRFPLRDAQGRVTGTAGVATDMTRLLLERRRLRDLAGQLSGSRRLVALGSLAEGLAHDLGNVLVALGGYVELALAVQPADDAGQAPLLREALAASARARQLLARFAEEGAARGSERALLQPAPLLREALRLVSVSASPAVELRCVLPARSPAVLGDAPALLSVFVNLATNAVAAMPDGGRLQVSLGVQARGGAEAARPAVLVSFEDTGHGMEPAVLERIFEPRFTTRGQRGGRGLGLSTARSIVAAHGGEIRVSSTPGAGSRFEVLLPVAGAESGAVTPPRS